MKRILGTEERCGHRPEEDHRSELSCRPSLGDILVSPESLSPSVAALAAWTLLLHEDGSLPQAPTLAFCFPASGSSDPCKVTHYQWELRDQLNAPAFHSSFFAEAILRCILHIPLRAQEGWSPRCHSSSPITPTLSLSHFPATHSCFLRPLPI